MSQLTIKYLLVPALAVLALSVNPGLAADLPQVEDGKGLVVFYRMDKLGGSAIRFNLNHASGTLGQLLRGTYLYKSVDPGEHTFWSQVISKDSITIVVEAGKTYYVEGVVRMGLYAGRPNFNQVSKERALKALAAM
jgi:hypothetical protein